MRHMFHKASIKAFLILNGFRFQYYVKAYETVYKTRTSLENSVRTSVVDDATAVFENNLFTPSCQRRKCQEYSSCETDGILSQVSANALIVDQNSFTCEFSKWDNNSSKYLERYTDPHKQAVCFDLKTQGCSTVSRTINSVTFGIERVIGGPISLTFSLYKDCGCRLGRPGTSNEQLIGGSSLIVTESDNLSTKTFQLDNALVVAKDEAIRFEIAQTSSKPNDQNFHFFSTGTTTSDACSDTYVLSRCTGPSFVKLDTFYDYVKNLIVSIATSPSTEVVSRLAGCCSTTTDCKTIEDCVAGQCVLKNKCSNPTENTCNFYTECLAASYECGYIGYPLYVGDKFCKVFADKEIKLSKSAQEWTRDVRICLQQALAPVLQNEMCCDELQRYAYDTHAPCFFQSGFCTKVNFRDFLKIMYWTRSTRDSFTGKLRFLSEYFAIMKLCASTLF